MSFEFLSSFHDWEAECLRDAEAVDRIPIKKHWTECAQVLNTLAGYKGPAYDNLASHAKNGRPENRRRHSASVGGFPRLIAEGYDRSAVKEWTAFRSPSPEQLAALPVDTTLIRVDVELLTPFFSKDDTAFYPTDNVLRRDKVFELPFFSAAGIKGLLRWAHRMVQGSVQDDESACFLFGKANDTGEDSRQGALYVWPLVWEQCRIGQDIINPQHRDTGAGTVPVKYEVVKAGGRGTLWLLLVPPFGDKNGVRAHLSVLLEDLAWLLEKGGLSAKQTSGWGTVKVTGCNAAVVGCEQRKNGTGGSADDDVWSAFAADGQLKDYDPDVFTGNRLKALLGWSNKQIKDRDAAYAEVQRLFEQKFGGGGGESDTLGWYWPDGRGPKTLTEFRTELVSLMKEEKTHG